MSLVGVNVAIVSLGMSCQTTWQIQSNAPLIATLLRTADRVSQGGMPFDWLICPPVSVANMLAARSFFPAAKAQLQLNHAPYWPEHNVYYWHDFRLPAGGYDTAAGFEQATAKYQYLLNRFSGLSSMARRIFVISNTQNNLDQVARSTGTISDRMAAVDIETLCEATDRFFSQPCEYIVVSYADRIDRAVNRKRVKTYLIAKDHSDWKGDGEQWARVFRDFLSCSPQ